MLNMAKHISLLTSPISLLLFIFNILMLHFLVSFSLFFVVLTSLHVFNLFPLFILFLVLKIVLKFHYFIMLLGMNVLNFLIDS